MGAKNPTMADATTPPNDGNPEDAQNLVSICPDGHSCENGSLCIENALKEGQYFCDCDEGELAGFKVFTGLYCQHEATVFCTMTGELSTVGFCANGGTCMGFLEDNGNNHVGCECPKGYTGKVSVPFVVTHTLLELFGIEEISPSIISSVMK